MQNQAAYVRLPTPLSIQLNAVQRNAVSYASRSVAEELWDVAAVAEYLGVTPSTVRSYLSRRQMPPADYTLSGAPVWRATTIRSWHKERPSQRPQ